MNRYSGRYESFLNRAAPVFDVPPDVEREPVMPMRMRPVSYRRAARFFEPPVERVIVIPPDPPQPKKKKKKQGPKWREIIEQELRARAAWLEYCREAKSPIFLFELREKVRESYKPPPPHYRSFSKMLPSYSDGWLKLPPGFSWKSRRWKSE